MKKGCNSLADHRASEIINILPSLLVVNILNEVEPGVELETKTWFETALLAPHMLKQAHLLVGAVSNSRAQVATGATASWGSKDSGRNGGRCYHRAKKVAEDSWELSHCDYEETVVYRSLDMLR